ncbi:hypothetical protein Pan44_53570 [Caulifigura coniformis]|uniref:Uncharacterized protein n=1 Tax=Caulifigura coniformis TaxID=2527983 RepID=A0A517SME0_9PLAN|nr:hypothetical protein [Caulifigura coniformis]QDT57289.1 hypothetical protein Pan44_53570 [Caulifigura coniformis]
MAKEMRQTGAEQADDVHRRLIRAIRNSGLRLQCSQCEYDPELWEWIIHAAASVPSNSLEQVHIDVDGSLPEEGEFPLWAEVHVTILLPGATRPFVRSPSRVRLSELEAELSDVNEEVETVLCLILTSENDSPRRVGATDWEWEEPEEELDVELE